MNLNAQSRFSVAPDIEIQRSRFDRSYQHKTTFSAGSLIPIYLDECLAGDTLTLDVSSLVRMSTPIFPTLDNAYLDLYFFYVPSRILWTHWRNFMGENTESYWTPTTEYSIPQTIAPLVTGWKKGTIADYMGIPTQMPDVSVSSLPFRAYCMIWNEWFRAQTVMPPVYLPLGDATQSGTNHTDQSTLDDLNLPYDPVNAIGGGSPLPVCRFHDYFSSMLPQPQRGEAVDIPLFDANVPVTTSAVPHNMADYPLEVENSNIANGSIYPLYGKAINVDGVTQAAIAFNAASSNPGGSWSGAIPSNLEIDMKNVVASSILQLRQAFQIQRLLERDARCGCRYREVLRGHFGVAPTDARMQVPEFLGARRIPINIDQVLQTSATNEVSPQGNTAAFSLSTDVSSILTKSFEEPGYVIGVCCVRTDNTYQQGLNRMFSRKRRYDFYWPELANLSEQAVLRKELYCSGVSAENEEAIGFQECWADYRYSPSRVSSAFRSNYQTTLDSWHYADYYEGDPRDFVLQATWLASPAKQNIDRTLAIPSSIEDQFIADFYFKAIWTRPMPMFSVPGLADHH